MIEMNQCSIVSSATVYVSSRGVRTYLEVCLKMIQPVTDTVSSNFSRHGVYMSKVFCWVQTTDRNRIQVCSWWVCVSVLFLIWDILLSVLMCLQPVASRGKTGWNLLWWLQDQGFFFVGSVSVFVSELIIHYSTTTAFMCYAFLFLLMCRHGNWHHYSSFWITSLEII